MAVNDYRCGCGVREVYHEANSPPKRCMDCGKRMYWVIANNQFGMVGDMTWLNELELRGIELQLGRRPSSREDLRRLEKEKGVERVSKQELLRHNGHHSWSPPKKFELPRELVAKEFAKARAKR